MKTMFRIGAKWIRQEQAEWEPEKGLLQSSGGREGSQIAPSVSASSLQTDPRTSGNGCRGSCRAAFDPCSSVDPLSPAVGTEQVRDGTARSRVLLSAVFPCKHPEALNQ